MSKKFNRAMPAVICFIFVLSVILLPSWALYYHNLKLSTPPPASHFTITAHTGCEGTQINSLQSISCGAQSGASCVEFDIRFLNDGTPVLAHDKEDANEYSIRLEDAFELLKNYEVGINLDLKEVTHLDNIVSLITLYDIHDRCFFTGVTESQVAAVKNLHIAIPFYLNVKLSLLQKNDYDYILSIAQTAQSIGAIGINLKHTAATRKNVELWHSHGLLVSVYTVNSTVKINSALYKNVDNITTLRPTLARNLSDFS